MKMQILELGLLILAAYIGGLIARKLKIGEVIGQIFGGILVGPHFLELLHRLLNNIPTFQQNPLFRPIYHFYNDGGFDEYESILESYHFFVFLFLGLIAFSLGEELHRNRLKQVGIKATIICLIQGLLTFFLLSLGFHFIFKLQLITSLILGSIGIATAPALTFVLMNKLKIEGKLKNILANIVVLDDILEVVFFSIFLSIAMSKQRGAHLSAFHVTWDVVQELFLACVIGFLIFLVLKFSLRERKPDVIDEELDNETFLATVLSEHPTPSVEILLLMVGIISVGISVAINFNLPFLITAVMAGFLISNFHNNAIFDSLKIENVMPIFNLMFFAIIGASVRLESFSKDTLWFVIGYVVLRSAGKLFGNWFGAKLTSQDPKIAATLPKLMLPQAGMAAVETILVATTLKGGDGLLIFNTIIPALVVFELGGAYLSEKTLLQWKNYTVGEREAVQEINEDNKYSLASLLGDRVVEMMATNQQEAIFELAQIMVKQHIINETNMITNSIAERERLSSTGIGNGIAIPHCRLSGIDKTYVAAGLLRHPVDWNAPDGKPIELLFLILTPDGKPEEHLKSIRAIATAVRQHDLKTEFMKALRSVDLVDTLKAIG
ncbi:MAG TPA: cation:proton antiporter [Candidatus Cloacimonadota bacterium]|nr:cation:proton antiporter [Candidatus Cloacimonadota bacterium]